MTTQELIDGLRQKADELHHLAYKLEAAVAILEEQEAQA